MKYRLIAVGKVREPYVAAAVEDFRGRFARYEAFDEIEVAASHGGDEARAVREESERILKALAPGDILWLLERTGTQFSSVALSQRLRALGDAGTARIVFAIAGPYGASDALLARANVRWSLSELTLLHEWSRALVLEQLYRAAKIARNEPYHH
ncbi:MAG: 23S rRNA (pseudouridine(1915)-N(3))-methyltransferase RlmH [Candidatus Eremiobacteraeota bacterium]|nr:23S rRNA (pseudouridine(1915)-N(3))-methyltransferase RlmH [Candidatus Eremiobacteraeota bacterium]